MAFKIRDLVITIVPTLTPFDPVAEPCDAGSEVPPGPPPDPPGPDPGPDTGFLDPFELSELRVLLQTALYRLGGPLSDAELRPQSVAELDDLEARLVGALDEVRILREDFGTLE